MATRHQNPRILVVTPEVTLVRHGMGPGARYISARAGGLGDICNAQIHALYKHGLDVHLAMPNYRNVFTWAIDQAMAFYRQPREFRSSQVQRIMTDSLVRFDPGDTARQTIDLYARALERPLVHLKAAPGQSDSSQIAA